MGYDKGRSRALPMVRILFGILFFSSLTAAVCTMSRIAVVTGSNKGEVGKTLRCCARLCALGALLVFYKLELRRHRVITVELHCTLLKQNESNSSVEKQRRARNFE